MYDVIVVGGGPAGMSASLQSAQQGAKTLLIDRESSLGGILKQCIHNGFGLHYFKEELTGPEYAEKFKQLLAHSSVQVMLDTFVLEVGDGYVVVINKDGQKKIKAKSIVYACGCREKTAASITLTGSRCAGIYTAGQAQKMVNAYGKLPGKNVVILGSGDIGLIMARRLSYEGANVKMVLEIASTVSGLYRNVKQCLEDNNIPLKLSTTVTRVVGKNRIEGVYISKVKNFVPDGEEEFVPCDALILSVGLQPEIELIEGVALNKVTSSLNIDEHYMVIGRKGLFISGNVLHVNDLADNVTVESQIAGKYAAQYAMGKLDTSRTTKKISAGNNVRYVLPSLYYVTKNGEIMLSFRVLSRMEDCYIIVKNGTDTIYKSRQKVVMPSTLINIKLPKDNLTKDLVVEISKE